jgi:hypothetical protein
MRLSVIVPAALFGLLPLACGGSEPDPNDPSQAQNQYGGGQYQPQGGQYQQGQQTGYPQQGQTGYPQQGQTGYPQQGGTTQPGAVPGAQPAAGGGSATPVAPAMAGAATPVLTAMAAAEVQGMQPEGGAFAAQFQPGQTFEQPFNMQGGKCYAVIGVGLGITELDIQIVAQQPPLPAVVLSQDNTTGSNATLGGKGACFKNPLPIGGPAKVILKATGGQGIGVAQIYVK